MTPRGIQPVGRACPTPDKKAYESRTAARFFARCDGLRPYLCPCGTWHLSSKRVDQFRRKA